MEETTAASVSEDLYNSIDDVLSDAIDALELGLVDEFGPRGRSVRTGKGITASRMTKVSAAVRVRP